MMLMSQLYVEINKVYGVAPSDVFLFIENKTNEILDRLFERCEHLDKASLNNEYVRETILLRTEVLKEFTKKYPAKTSPDFALIDLLSTVIIDAIPNAHILDDAKICSMYAEAKLGLRSDYCSRLGLLFTRNQNN